MLEAKLPPPNPAIAATSSIIQNGVSGRVTKYASADVGMNSTVALNIVQLRPPNFVTAKVYGNRISEPISPGNATSWNSSSVVYGNPACGSLVATILQTSQIEKPRCSATIDQIRLRRAIRLPRVSQNVSSSGRQSTIQLLCRSRIESVLFRSVSPSAGRNRAGSRCETEASLVPEVFGSRGGPVSHDGRQPPDHSLSPLPANCAMHDQRALIRVRHNH